jgi:uncharacterized damage-inducible protein DinB
MQPLEQQLIETWNIHNRINLYMLDAITPEALTGVSASKQPKVAGRNVAEQFAHMHNVRLGWLEHSAADLFATLRKIEKGEGSDKDLLRRSLDDSGNAIAMLLQRGIGAGGKIKNFKPHAAAFMGYLISHESYHRGEIGIILAQSGHPLDKKISYGMWEWGAR